MMADMSRDGVPAATVRLLGEKVVDRPDLLAAPVSAALEALGARRARAPFDADRVRVAEIDPDLADTAAFCAAYGVPLEASANCVVVAGSRAGQVRYAACVLLATTRLDVNGLVRRRLDARRASFAPVEEAVRLSGMEYGGITPIGLPGEWSLWIDAAVVSGGEVVIGSGLRRSKLVLDGARLADLPGAEVVDGLARPVTATS
jgi:prolyl-tRNA editing enzyme YbaK/EbsC (Cys-tRNA(Pro) deacylase)